HPRCHRCPGAFPPDHRSPVRVALADSGGRRGVLRRARPLSGRQPVPPRAGRDLAGLKGRVRAMPMRTDCKFYESRTYDSGEVVRKCRIDLAPEAPWRCPDECGGYRRRMVDAGWTYGSMSQGVQAPEPEPNGDDVTALLNEAEEIVNA